MNSPHKPDQTEQTNQHNQTAFWLSVIFLIVTLGILLASILEDIGNQTSPFYATNYIIGLAVLSSLVSLALSRSQYMGWGIIQLVIVLIGASLRIVTLYYGIGVLLGIVLILSVALLAYASLTTPFLGWTIILGILGGSAVILIDVFFEGERSFTELIKILPLIMGGLLLVSSYVVFRQFKKLGLREKIIIGFIGVTLITVFVITFYNQRNNSIQLTENVGSDLKRNSEAVGIILGENLSRQVDLVLALSLNDTVQQALIESNQGYQGSTTELLQAIEDLDRIWRAADAEDDNHHPIVAERLNNAAAYELGKFRNQFPDHLEIFVTDRFGALVASTNRTSDYYQADEDWWKSAYRDGTGDIYISSPEYDLSAEALAVLIAMPIYDQDNQKILGVIRSTYLLSAIEKLINTESIAPENTGQTEIIFPGAEPSRYEVSKELALVKAEDYYLKAIELGEIQSYFTLNMGGSDNIVSVATIQDVTRRPEISRLNWKVIVRQNLLEALEPVTKQTRMALVISLIVGITAVAIGTWVSQNITRPAIRLREVAQRVGAGDLTARATIETSDEIGDLAKTFNATTEQLQETLSGLEQRIAERTRAIETSALVGRRLSTILDENQLVREVVEQLQKSFNYYHVQIYTWDENKENLILAGGSGEAGQALLARGHKIPAHIGLVGRATDLGTVVLVEDTTQDPNWLPNPLLPETKSEIAVPIILGDEVLGALDVQQDKVNGLGQQDSDLLQLVTSQIAATLRNARLYAQAEHRAVQERNFISLVEHIQSTATVEEALQIASREVGRLVDAPLTVVKVSSKDQGTPQNP